MRLFRRHAKHIGLQELSGFVDDRLAVNRKRQVEAHLESCGLCREGLEGLQYTVGLLKQAPMLAPRRRLVMPDAPAAVVARPMIISWAYGAAASVAVLLAVVLGADLMGALPGGGSDFAIEDSAFSDDQFSSAVPMEAEMADFEETESSGEPVMEAQVASKTLAEEAQESEPPKEAREARSTTEALEEAQEDEGTHILWRALEGVLAALLALLLGVALWRIRRSRRPTP